MPRDIKFNAGFNGCEDRMNILKNITVPRDLDKFEEINSDDVDLNTYIYVDKGDGNHVKIKLGEVMTSRATQPDWNETNPESYAYIKNKPEFLLEKDFVSLYNVGGIYAGQVFEAGKTVWDIIQEMLSVTGEAVFRFGVVDADIHGALPGDFTVYDLVEIDRCKIAELVNKGWRPNKDDIPNATFDENGALVLTPGSTGNGQFFVMAVPKSANYELDNCFQAGYALGLVKMSLDNEWYVYLNADDLYLYRNKQINDEDNINEGDDGTIYQLSPNVGSYVFDYKFRLKK